MPDLARHDARGLSELLAEHARTVSSERVSLAEIADFLGTRSIGAWLLILALPMVLPVPAPGISVLFGMPLMMISAQLALGGRQVWLPAFYPSAITGMRGLRGAGGAHAARNGTFQAACATEGFVACQ